MKHILFTTEEGGNFRYTRGGDDEDTVLFYQKLVKKGEIALKTGDFVPEPEKLAYVMLLEEEDHHDFVLADKLPETKGKRY